MTIPAARAQPDELVADEIFTDPLSRPYPAAVRAFRPDAPMEDLSDIDRTDAGVVRDLALAFQNEIAFEHRAGDWLWYDAPVWRRDQVCRALHRVQEHLEQRVIDSIRTGRAKTDREARKHALKQLDARHMRHLLELLKAQPGIALDGSEFNRDPYLFAVANGVFRDVRAGEASFGAGAPADFVSLQSPVKYDPAATAPVFNAFLLSTFEGDEQLIAFMRRWFGYCLTGATHEQVFVAFFGAGGNGKGVLSDAIAELLGSYALTLPFASFLRSNVSGASATPDLARLPGRRLARASESRPSGHLADDKIKALTGEDVIAARPMYGTQFEFQPCAKLLFLFNERPGVSDLTHGFWRRALLVPFPRRFDGADRDDQLRGKLRGELPGILKWALQGCEEWSREGLNPPASVQAAVAAWRQESDVVAEFVRTACEPAPEHWAHARDVYGAFLHWCDREHVPDRERPGRNAFTGRAREHAKWSRRGNGMGFYLRPRGRSE